MSEDGKRRVRASVAAAKPAGNADIATPAKPPEYLLELFESDTQGLFRKIPDKKRLWLSAPLEIRAAVRDSEQSGWGLLLCWRDPDGRLHEEVISRAQFAGEGGELRTLLASGGLLMNPRQDARQALLEYLNAASPTARAHVVSRSGWARIGGEPTFVLPHQTFGKTGERVLLHTATREPSPFNQSGTHRDWIEQVSVPAIGNSRLLLALSAAFVGPLLEPLGEEGGGVHFRGPAKIAKTLVMVMAGSVWGGAPGAGAKCFVLNWRGTSNAIEGTAALHSDTFAAFDEAGQVDGKELADIVYLLANGRGKMRSDRTGAPRATLRFRLMYLSSGEISLGAKMAEAGKILRAGQEVRCIDLPADAGKGFGIFDTLGDEAESAEALAQSLYAATRTLYGTAAPVYLGFVVDTLRRDPDFPSRLTKQVDALTAEWLSAHAGGSGQVRTVTRRFALIAVAGELASLAGATGWGPGLATEGVRQCFEAWLADRGTSGAREDVQAAEQLRNFISRHGESRFEDWKGRSSQDDPMQATNDEPPVQRFRIVNRAGWRRWLPELRVWKYFITKDVMQSEVLSGLDYNAGVKTLVKRGLIIADRWGKNQVAVQPPSYGKMRLFQISTNLFGEDGDNEQSAWTAADTETANHAE